MVKIKKGFVESGLSVCEKLMQSTMEPFGNGGFLYGALNAHANRGKT